MEEINATVRGAVALTLVKMPDYCQKVLNGQTNLQRMQPCLPGKTVEELERFLLDGDSKAQWQEVAGMELGDGLKSYKTSVTVMLPKGVRKIRPSDEVLLADLKGSGQQQAYVEKSLHNDEPVLMELTLITFTDDDGDQLLATILPARSAKASRVSFTGRNRLITGTDAIARGIVLAEAIDIVELCLATPPELFDETPVRKKERDLLYA